MGKMKSLLIDILTLHEGGYTIAEIADLHGLTPEFVVKVLKDCGFEVDCT